MHAMAASDTCQVPRAPWVGTSFYSEKWGSSLRQQVRESSTLSLVVSVRDGDSLLTFA